MLQGYVEWRQWKVSSTPALFPDGAPRLSMTAPPEWWKAVWRQGKAIAAPPLYPDIQESDTVPTPAPLAPSLQHVLDEPETRLSARSKGKQRAIPPLPISSSTMAVPGTLPESPPASVPPTSPSAVALEADGMPLSGRDDWPPSVVARRSPSSGIAIPAMPAVLAPTELEWAARQESIPGAAHNPHVPVITGMLVSPAT